MAGHDAADSGSDRGAKGNQFQVLEAIFVGANHRQIDVRIRGGVAVAGEMLGGGEAAVFFHAAHESGDEFGDALGIFAERAGIDDGIAGIIVHVGNRRVNPVNADGAGFQRGDFSHGVGVGGISAGGQGHRGGEGGAFVEAHGGAAFEICADEQRQFGAGLQLVGEHGGRVGLALDDAQRRHLRDVDEAADVQVVDIVHHFFIRSGIGGGEAAVIGGEKKLADFFVIGHFAQRGFHPLFVGGGKRARAGSFGRTRRRFWRGGFLRR